MQEFLQLIDFRSPVMFLERVSLQKKGSSPSNVLLGEVSAYCNCTSIICLNSVNCVAEIVFAKHLMVEVVNCNDSILIVFCVAWN